MHHIPQTIKEPDSYKDLQRHSSFHIEQATADRKNEKSRMTAENQSKMTVEKGSPFPNKQVYDNSEQKIKILDDQDFENMASTPDVMSGHFNNKGEEMYYHDDPKMQTLKS